MGKQYQQEKDENNIKHEEKEKEKKMMLTTTGMMEVEEDGIVDTEKSNEHSLFPEKSESRNFLVKANSSSPSSLEASSMHVDDLVNSNDDINDDNNTGAPNVSSTNAMSAVDNEKRMDKLRLSGDYRQQ